jgi:hypothetical protein
MLYILGIRPRSNDSNGEDILDRAIAGGATSEGLSLRGRRGANPPPRAAVILEPLAEDWSWLDLLAGQVDNDFVRAVNEQPIPQERPALDKLFG